MGTKVSKALNSQEVNHVLRGLARRLGVGGGQGQNWSRAAPKQVSGSLIDVGRRVLRAGAAKQQSAPDDRVINMLSELNSRLDRLAERSGVSPGELGVSTNLQNAFANARASGLNREDLTRLVQEELERAFKGK